MTIEIIDGKIDGFMTTDEAAERFGVKQVTIRQWIRRNKFKYGDVLKIKYGNNDNCVAIFIRENSNYNFSGKAERDLYL